MVKGDLRLGAYQKKKKLRIRSLRGSKHDPWILLTIITKVCMRNYKQEVLYKS